MLSDEMKMNLLVILNDYVKELKSKEKGLTIAKSKARTELERLKIHKQYITEIKILKSKCKTLQDLIYEKQE